MAEESFLGFASRVASTFMGGAPDGPRHAWQALAPWFTELTKSATTRWLPNLVHGIHCEVVQRDPATGSPIDCKGAAIAACEVCHLPCCIDHSFVQKQAAAVCYACVTVAAAERAPKIPGNGRPADPAGSAWSGAGGARRGTPHAASPPSPVDPRFAEARKVLGIKKSATWNEIEERYKALLRKHHPDRNPADKAAAELRFKAVRSAYDFLKLSQTESPP